MLDEIAKHLSESSIALSLIFGTIFVCVLINIYLTLFIAHAMRHSSKWPGKKQTISEAISSGEKLSICAVIGSGGHTTEMSALLSKLNPDLFIPRQYILAETDKMGMDKIMEVEKRLYSNQKVEENSEKTFSVNRIPRSREVGQSYVSAIFTTLWAILSCVKTIWTLK